MDPNATLREMLDDAKRVLTDADMSRSEMDDTSMHLAERVQAIDNWLRNGGFLPSAWNRHKPGCSCGSPDCPEWQEAQKPCPQGWDHV